MKLVAKSMFIIAASASALTGFASPAYSEPSASEVLKMIERNDQQSQMALLILNGYANGFDWTNTDLFAKGEKRIFCLPTKLVITPEQNADIMKRFTSSNPDFSSKPAGMALLYAYKDTFPCQN